MRILIIFLLCLRFSDLMAANGQEAYLRVDTVIFKDGRKTGRPFRPYTVGNIRVSPSALYDSIFVDTTSISSRIDSKQNYSDTTTWDATTYFTNLGLSFKVNYADTGAMLLPYLRKVDTVGLSNRINLKLNSSDTTALSNRIDLKVPLTRSLTIAGTTQTLAADRTYTISTTNVSEGTNLYYTDARARAAISLTTTNPTPTYDNTTGVLNVPVTSINAATRPVNSTTWTVSTTREAMVIYYVQTSITSSIGTNSSASISLQYSTNGGGAWTEIGRATNSTAVALAVALSVTNTQVTPIVAKIGANWLLRMVSTTSGTASTSYILF